MPAQKGTIQPAVIIVTLVVLGLGFFAFSSGKIQLPPPFSPVNSPDTFSPNPPLPPGQKASATSSSAKGVVIIETPAKGEEIKSPLTVTGLVYGNNGTLTIKLKQKESGMYVTQDKVVKISGKSDSISFVEAIMFGLPVMPQVGILEIVYQDESGKGLDDKVSIEVNFPSDLGRGE